MSSKKIWVAKIGQLLKSVLFWLYVPEISLKQRFLDSLLAGPMVRLLGTCCSGWSGGLWAGLCLWARAQRAPLAGYVAPTGWFGGSWAVLWPWASAQRPPLAGYVAPTGLAVRLSSLHLGHHDCVALESWLRSCSTGRQGFRITLAVDITCGTVSNVTESE